MKKLLIVFVLLANISFAQQKPEEKKVNIKNIKVCLFSAGAFTVAGAVTNVIKTYQPHTQKQKDLSRVSSMFYGLAGVSLFTVVLNF